MRKFVTLMVAVLLVVAALVPAFAVVNADGDDGIRSGEANTPATMIVKKWVKVGYDRDGNLLNPATGRDNDEGYPILAYSEATRKERDGTGYRYFPWQKIDEQIWGRGSDDVIYEMPFLLPTDDNHHWMERFDQSSPDYDYDLGTNNYAWYTTIFMNVEPNSGASQETVMWYAVIDRNGALWLDPDGKFHNCFYDNTADPMYYEPGTITYTSGTCRTNPRALIDPIPNNNTQGPYNLRFGERGALDKIYFWWKYDMNRDIVDRVWRVGWADMTDYDPIPNTDMLSRGWDYANANTWSVVSHIPTYDPYRKQTYPEADVDWDAKLDTIPFVQSGLPPSNPVIWPPTLLTEYTECYMDANGNGIYDPYEFIYTKGAGIAGVIDGTVQIGDTRISNVSTENGNFKVNYRAGSTIGPDDYDIGNPLIPFTHIDAPAGYPRYVHTHSATPDADYDLGEFIYFKGANATLFGQTYLQIPGFTGNTVLWVTDVTGFDVDDEIGIYDQTTNTWHITIIDAVDPAALPFPTITIDTPLPSNFIVFAMVAEIGEVELGDVRLTIVNKRHNNNPLSWRWHGAWWTDALILLEVLEGGCYTPKYNITVESDLWMGGYPRNGEFMKGNIPSEATAALRSPNGDLVAAAQRINKTTVLDPTGLDFEIVATTFENIKLEFREFIGLEIFKDDGINNNMGEDQFTINCVRGDITDDYMMYDSTEEFVGANDVETAKDYEWSINTIAFTADERYVDLSGEGSLGVGEPMYRDLDASSTVSDGDIRITDVVVENSNSNIISYPSGSVVTTGDADVDHFLPLGAELLAMPAGNEYHDMPHGCIPENGVYDVGEPIYYQAAQSGMVALYSNTFNNQNNPTGTPPNLTFFDNENPGSGVIPPAFAMTNTVNNWGELDKTNSGIFNNGGSLLPPGAPTSVADSDGVDYFGAPLPGGQIGNPAANNREVCFDSTNTAPVGATRCNELRSGMIILNPSLGMEDNKIFSADVFWQEEDSTDWESNPPAIIFNYRSPTDFWALYIMPDDGVSGSTPGSNVYYFDFSHEDGERWENWVGGFADPNYHVELFRYEPDGGSGYQTTPIWTGELPTVTYTDFMNFEIRSYANFGGTLDYTEIIMGGMVLSGSMPSAVVPPGSPPGGFGFLAQTETTWWGGTPNWSLYFDNVNLSTNMVGASMDTVRLVDVWVDGVFYPAGSRVVAGDFYRVQNPVYGVTMGGNQVDRYMDIEVLPGDIGLRYEIDGLSPDDDDFEPLKIEKTSHVKVYLDHELEGVYAKGKVIGDKRTRTFYRPDSFYVNTIPADQQVVYSSPSEAKQNFFHPHRSIQGDQVQITLRETDINIHPYNTGTLPTNTYLEEILDTTAILDAKNPSYEFEFTPYRGTIVDDLGQELPFLLRAYMDNGGIATAPLDSRFTYSFMRDKDPNGERTIDTQVAAYSDLNYIDPWHMDRKWEIDEAYANFWNQAYSRAARFVHAPYEAEFMAECGLSDKYDCFGLVKLHVEPEGIDLVPSSPCVDPLAYKYPNISLTLNAYDNPDDINDPAGYPMSVPLYDEHGDLQGGFATYNVNGAGIRYMCTMRVWNISHTAENSSYAIVQVNDDGSYIIWNWTEAGMINAPGVVDDGDFFFISTNPNMTYPFLRKFNNRGNSGWDVGDYDCSVGKGVVDLCGTGWPPLGDVTLFDTYGLYWDPHPNFNGRGTVSHYGVRSFISPRTLTDPGGKIAVICQPMNNEEELHIRVHTSNLVVDYNSSMLKHGNEAVYFATDRSGIFQSSPGDAGGTSTYDPGVSLNPDTNPPGIRNLTVMETIDYCDVIDLKVMPPDTDLNFNNFHIVDHALQYSTVNYVDATAPPGLVGLSTPERWIRPDYNPLCVLRPLSSNENTDVRCYPGGQTHLMRVENSLRGNGFNATPALWRKQFNKLGSEFFGLTDYGLYFELTREFGGYWGIPTTFTDGMIRRLEITGPFMTPLDLDPEFDSVKYRSGTAAGSMLGYSYKGLRYVPIKYDYSGQIVVDTLNYQTYELGMNNYTNRTSPACTIPGDFIDFTHTNSYLQTGRELDYRLVSRPQLNVPSTARTMVFDELIPIGPGRIDITVWLQDGTKKIFQDCCVEPPANGIDVSGIQIEGMPHFITVDEVNKIELKLTEGYGIETEGPPPEFGKGIQNYRECNDALVYVWQDRGIYDPVERLYDYAGDGYCSMAPQSTDMTDTYSPYTEDDDLNSDGKITFDNYETEIIGEYDINTNTWTNGLIDARTFHRQNGEYKFDVFTNTVGIDFGSNGTEAEPDHVIAPDEMLDVIVTAYKYGDDNNDRSFRPFYGGRETLDENAFSHEVYLAGRAKSFVEAKEDLTVGVIPEPLTAGCTPELLDPTAPLTFEVKWADGTPVDLRLGVPDPRGGDEVKSKDMWNHLFKDPHPDNQYYYPGKVLPQYYWLRTDLHNYDYTPICNSKMYGYDTDPFMPIEFWGNPKEGIYAFKGFVANDKGEFKTVIYTPDRRHKATATVTVGLPQVDYELQPREYITGSLINTFFPVNGSSDDFIATAADYRFYMTRFTFKSAQGRLIQGLAETTSVCQGGEGMYARFTPFFSRHSYFNWVGAPTTEMIAYRRYASHAQIYNFYLANTNPFGGRNCMTMLMDIDGSGTYGDVAEELLVFNSPYNNMAIRIGGEDGRQAPFYPTVNYMFEDNTYNYWQAWDGPYDEVSAGPAGYGVGAIYNNPYEGEYLFADSNRDFTFNYKDSYNIDNRGQGSAFVFVDGECEFGAIVGVTHHALKPKFSDIYGGSDPYNEYSPQRTQTRFVHIRQGNADLGTSDGAYALDWDAFPDKTVTAKNATAIPYWAETREEIGKDVLDPGNYDLAYGIENHIWVEFFPADPRDLPVPQLQTVSVANTDVLHPWGGAKSENVIFSTIIVDNVNPNTRAAQMFVTPTGTGTDIMALNKRGNLTGTSFFFQHCTSYNMIKFDVIMSIQVVAESLEPLKIGVPGTLIVSALKTAGGEPIEGATIHIKGAGVEMEKKTDAEGKVEFSITPTERGRILITAEKESMKGTYTSAFVERYVAPPMLDLDPVDPVTSENKTTIKGRTNEGTRITVNGRPVSIAKDGTFTAVIKLDPGKNSIIVVATNEESQTVTKVLMVESRVKASDIILDPIGEYQNVKQIRLRGHVEPGTEVTVTNTTTGKSFTATVSNDVFVADVDVEPGKNEFVIKATDKITGKETVLNADTYIWTSITLMFTLDSNVVIKDGVSEVMSVAPMEVDGTVMVPLQAIADYFEIISVPAGPAITLTWGSNTLTLTVGGTNATLNDTQVSLKAPPIVENGVMMIALDDVVFLKPDNGLVRVNIIPDSKTIVVCRRK